MELASVRTLRHAQVPTDDKGDTVSRATCDDRTFRRHCVYHPFFYRRMDGKRRVVCGLRSLEYFRVQLPPEMSVDLSPLLEVCMREGPLCLGPAQLRLYLLCKEVEGNYILYTTRLSLVCHTQGRLLIVAAHTRSQSVAVYTMKCWALRLEEA
ncbi:hypothetical protein EDD16DRAFT_1623647 [Pisolithus croceorrhizus]|nr:hypothetical protein EDD16DRAFT_1623647 [Pisolithus croceorrhizus]KAI6167799.1 hypothetical protein EDD17DRAFT_1535038 [Pisolithus thermaeus]